MEAGPVMVSAAGNKDSKPEISWAFQTKPVAAYTDALVLEA
jgi:hypothetical protein